PPITLPLLSLIAPPPPQSHPLSLHDALPISRDGCDPRESRDDRGLQGRRSRERQAVPRRLQDGEDPLYPEKAGDLPRRDRAGHADRKSTRLNSSHGSISYAVFCLKKKKDRKT